MLPEERKSLILEYVNLNHAVSTADLMKQFDASEATIRRDLTDMHAKGLLSKVHGGAVSLQNQIVSDYNVSDRAEQNMEEKIVIAKYAASLIQPNNLVYLDAGTTTGCMIDHIEVPNVTFVTNAIMHAKRLAAKGYPVYLTGGKLKATTEAMIGSECYEQIRKFHFSIGFFGVNAVNHDAGFMTPDPEEAKIKECAIRHTLSPYILCDHAKFDLIAPVSFASYHHANMITTKSIPYAYRKDENLVFADN